MALFLAFLAPTAIAEHGQEHSDQAAQNAEDGSDNASATGQENSEDDGSDNASDTGQESSEAGSDNASDTGQESSEAGGDNASATGQESSEAGGDNASATGQENSEGNQSASHGNSGTVKVGPIIQAEIEPDNEPHVPCQFQLEFFQFPEEASTVSVSFEGQAPSGSGPIQADPSSYTLQHESEDEPTPNGSVTYDFEDVDGLEYHDQQGYHVKVTVKADTAPDGATGKQKVFWVDCGPDADVDDEVVSSEDDDEVTASGDDEVTASGDDEVTASGDDEVTVSGDEEVTASEGDDEVTVSGDDEVAASEGDDEVTASGDEVPTSVDTEETEEAVGVAGVEVTAPGPETSTPALVLGVQHEAEEVQSAPADATLPRTGVSVLALVVGGLLSLGGGEFMRRRTSS